MDKVKQRLQLLAFVSIFFLYRSISSETFEEQMLWLSITVVYLMSLIVSYIVIKISESRYSSPREI